MSATPSFQPPTALEYFAALVAEDAGLPLTEAAVSIGQDDDPTLDVQQCLAAIDALADRLRRRLPADASPLQRLSMLNRYFFSELGFSGNVNNYYAPANSYLHRVLESRRGIPITLAVLYIELATQLGLKARGVSFPGHFLVKLRLPRGEAVIDPFTGASLSREELDERLLPYRRQQGLLGDDEVPLGLFLQAAEPRDVLARMLRNLKEIHRTGEDWHRLLQVQRRLVLLLPQAWEERRDRGLTLAELSHWAEAADDIDEYLRHRPLAEDARALRARAAELRRLARPNLH